MSNEYPSDSPSLFFLAAISVSVIYIVKKLFASYLPAKDRYVLVTGCDRGIGHKTAMELNDLGVKVFAGCLYEESVSKYEEDINFKGYPLRMDVTKDKDVKNAYEFIESKVGEKGLWCVVSNAGILQPGIIEWQSIDDMRKPMEVNLWGAINVIKTMLPLIKKNNGRFVNITSMAGRVWFGSHTAYSMSKYAFEAFSDGLRFEMKQWNISVHIIEPGMFLTPILNVDELENEWRELYKTQPETIKEQYGEDYLNTVISNIRDMIKKLASPKIHKVSNAVVHATLASSPKKRYVIGFDAWTIWIAIAVLPTYMGDFIMKVANQIPVPKFMRSNKQCSG